MQELEKGVLSVNAHIAPNNRAGVIGDDFAFLLMRLPLLSISNC